MAGPANPRTLSKCLKGLHHAHHTALAHQKETSQEARHTRRVLKTWILPRKIAKTIRKKKPAIAEIHSLQDMTGDHVAHAHSMMQWHQPSASAAGEVKYARCQNSVVCKLHVETIKSSFPAPEGIKLDSVSSPITPQKGNSLCSNIFQTSGTIKIPRHGRLWSWRSQC